MEVACCEFSSTVKEWTFTPSQLTVWTACSKSEAIPSIYWSLGKSPLFFLWHFGLSNFVSVIIREQKGLRKRDYLEKCPGSLNKIPEIDSCVTAGGLMKRISCITPLAAYGSNRNVKEGTLRKIRNRQLLIFKLLSQLHSRSILSSPGWQLTLCKW